MMSGIEKEIVLAFAKNNMSKTKTATELYRHRNTVIYHLEKIQKSFGLDPQNFYDLIKLVEIAKGGVEPCD